MNHTKPGTLITVKTFKKKRGGTGKKATVQSVNAQGVCKECGNAYGATFKHMKRALKSEIPALAGVQVSKRGNTFVEGLIL